MWFSPKILGLNARILGTVSDSLGLDFRTVFGQSRTKILGLFWTVPRLICELLLVHVCCFCMLFLKK